MRKQLTALILGTLAGSLYGCSVLGERPESTKIDLDGTSISQMRVLNKKKSQSDEEKLAGKDDEANLDPTTVVRYKSQYLQANLDAKKYVAEKEINFNQINEKEVKGVKYSLPGDVDRLSLFCGLGGYLNAKMKKIEADDDYKAAIQYNEQAAKDIQAKMTEANPECSNIAEVFAEGSATFNLDEVDLDNLTENTKDENGSLRDYLLKEIAKDHPDVTKVLFKQLPQELIDQFTSSFQPNLNTVTINVKKQIYFFTSCSSAPSKLVAYVHEGNQFIQAESVVVDTDKKVVRITTRVKIAKDDAAKLQLNVGKNQTMELEDLKFGEQKISIMSNNEYEVVSTYELQMGDVPAVTEPTKTEEKKPEETTTPPEEKKEETTTTETTVTPNEETKAVETNSNSTGNTTTNKPKRERTTTQKKKLAEGTGNKNKGGSTTTTQTNKQQQQVSNQNPVIPAKPAPPAYNLTLNVPQFVYTPQKPIDLYEEIRRDAVIHSDHLGVRNAKLEKYAEHMQKEMLKQMAIQQKLEGNADFTVPTDTTSSNANLGQQAANLVTPAKVLPKIATVFPKTDKNKWFSTKMNGHAKNFYKIIKDKNDVETVEYQAGTKNMAFWDKDSYKSPAYTDAQVNEIAKKYTYVRNVAFKVKVSAPQEKNKSSYVELGQHKLTYEDVLFDQYYQPDVDGNRPKIKETVRQLVQASLDPSIGMRVQDWKVKLMYADNGQFTAFWSSSQTEATGYTKNGSNVLLSGNRADHWYEISKSPDKYVGAVPQGFNASRGSRVPSSFAIECDDKNDNCVAEFQLQIKTSLSGQWIMAYINTGYIKETTLYTAPVSRQTVLDGVTNSFNNPKQINRNEMAIYGGFELGDHQPGEATVKYLSPAELKKKGYLKKQKDYTPYASGHVLFPGDTSELYLDLISSTNG